jgi:hypothetical protein
MPCVDFFAIKKYKEILLNFLKYFFKKVKYFLLVKKVNYYKNLSFCRKSLTFLQRKAL